MAVAVPVLVIMGLVVVGALGLRAGGAISQRTTAARQSVPGAVAALN
ncbi:MAG: hypothetical protein ACREC5_07410 [Thermoplasmata archaeon]